MTDAGKKPLVIIGGLAAAHRDRVREFVRILNAPCYAEALSGLREDASLPHITAGERMIARGNFDSVIRVGNVPTLRFWRDLDTSALPVVHYSDLPFPGLTRGEVLPIEGLREPVSASSVDGQFFAEDAELRSQIDAILDEEPESELAMLRAFSRQLPDRARIYLGNSLPIREWDLVASRDDRGFEYEANRGANGIDGQLSTFFGWCAADRENVCILGDLTTLYDLGAPWIVRQLDEGVRFRVVVINNGGGRIFGRVASLKQVETSVRERIIENVHDVRFTAWAEMWGLDVLELRPDAEASARVWARYDALWS
jgi:2-succinyl-5-enolpyruvyl-6-hydroxy-3-cyclohexene-1-carboxylate synthase